MIVYNLSMQIKKCIQCEKDFERPKCIANHVWEKRKLCSPSCRFLWQKENKIGFQKGHPGYKNKTSFPKGHKPWNKGKEIGKPAWLKFQHLKQFHGMNKGRRMSLSQRKKMSRDRVGKPLFKNRGEKHWNWKGGTRNLRKNIMELYMYRFWRHMVYERSDWTCEHCGIKGGKLHADHIKPFHQIITDNKITTVQEAKMCAELWDVFNGRTLCVSCHMKTDTYGGKRKN